MKQIAFAVSVFFLSIGLRTASAQLFSSLTMDQGVFVSTSQTGATTVSLINATSAPFQQTVTAVGPEGGSASATYSVTDNGSVATLDINASGDLTTANNEVSENQYDQGSDFTLSQPVNFTLELSEQGAGVLSFSLANGPFINVDLSDTTRYFSGTLDNTAAAPARLIESWYLYNQPGQPPTDQTGSDSIDFTFYATEPLPEPASAAVFGIPALALLGRRRRV